MNVALEIAKEKSTVKVTGEAPLIQAENGDVSTTMNQKQISEVPNHRYRHPQGMLARSSGALSAARWNNSSICAQRSGVKWLLTVLDFLLQPCFRHSQIAPDGNRALSFLYSA